MRNAHGAFFYARWYLTKSQDYTKSLSSSIGSIILSFAQTRNFFDNFAYRSVKPQRVHT